MTGFNEKVLKGIQSRWSEIALAATVCVVTFLLMFPLLYFLRENNNDFDKCNEKLMNLSNATVMMKSTQSSPQSYNGSLCLQELQNWQRCLPEIYMPSIIDQELREELAQVLFMDLKLLNHSKECQEELKSLYCLQTFGVCNENDQRRLPTYNDCIYLDYNTCCEVIQQASVYISLLLECNNFNSNFSFCDGGFSSTVNVTCSDQFFFDNSSLICKPECGVWTPLPSTAARVILIIASAVGLFGCIAVLILICFNRKKMLSFPTVLVIYQMMALIANILFVGPSFYLLCNSQDLIQNLSPGQATIYCQISGAVYLYTVFVIILLWLFQCATFFWGVMWPLHYRVTRESGRIKYIHVTVVAISFILPIISVVYIHFSGGFGLFALLPLFCFSNKSEDSLYAFAIPFNLTIIIGTVLLLVTGWRIADFKNKCCQMESNRRSRKRTSQNKILLLTSYVFTVAFYSNISITNLLSRKEQYVKAISEYFMCEALGEDMECSIDNFHQLESDLYAFFVKYVLFTLLPYVYFVFLFDYSICCVHKKPMSHRLSAISTSVQ